MIHTPHLTLTPLCLAHVEHVYSLLSSAEHTRYLSLPTATDREAVRAMTIGMLGQARTHLWLITETRTTDFVGLCGFLADATVPNFIYSITESKQRRGYAFEAATAAISAGRRLLGTDEVELNIHAQNVASVSVATKLGFRKVGEFQHTYPQQVELATVHTFRKTFSPNPSES